jgi:flagellin
MFGDLTRVGANFHAMEAWSNLKKVNGGIGQIQSRLSTGKRINSAEDDTSGYALSKHLESRTRGLSQALGNVGTAKNVLNIAEGGYQSQMSILQNVKEKLTQAADGSWSAEQRYAIGDQIESLLQEFDDINDQTKFNDASLFGSTTTFQVGEKNGDTLAVSFDTSNRNAVGETLGVNLDSIVGEVVDEYTITVAANGTFDLNDLGNYTSGDVVTAKDSDGAALTEGTGNDFVMNQSTDTPSVDTGVLTFAAQGTYTVSHTYGGSAAGEAVDWGALTQAEAQAGISKVDDAIKSLAKSIQSVGDSNARLSSKEESLSLAISNTEATRSRIEDADFAKEQMNMMKLQILQQTTVSSFSQANSAPQMVLGLFR